MYQVAARPGLDMRPRLGEMQVVVNGELVVPGEHCRTAQAGILGRAPAGSATSHVSSSPAELPVPSTLPSEEGS
jgi:hypothetical protein